jgi:hypothetical protein
MCDRIVECFSDAAGMHARCVDEFQSVLTCSSVQSVGSSYDDCMDQLDSRSCRTLFPTTDSGGPRLVLPDACNGVLSDGTSRQSAAATHWLNTPLSNLLDGMVDVTGGDGLSPRP